MTSELIGRTIPWVTLWSGEVVDVRTVQLRPSLDELRLSDEDFSDRFMNVLWHPVKVGPTGGPLFAEVHSIRQRGAMLDPQCQVCAQPLGTKDIPWVMPGVEWAELPAHAYRTITPPTCESCWDGVRSRCPRLRSRGHVRFRVGKVEPWGFYGDIYHPLVKAQNVQAAFGSPKTRHMLARQIVVTLKGVRFDSIVEAVTEANSE